MAGNDQRPKRILAIASGGGHWVQLLRLRPAWDGCEVTYASTMEGYQSEVLHDAQLRGQPTPRCVILPEANRWQKLRLLKLVVKLSWLLVWLRPDVIITTGAAHGFLAIRFGRLLGARTVWIDSIANVDELSLSGKMAGRVAEVWLTQWPHLAQPEGPRYEGAVL